MLSRYKYKYYFRNSKIASNEFNKKGHTTPKNKIPAENVSFRKKFLYLHPRATTQRMTTAGTYNDPHRETYRGLMMMSMCNRFRRG